MKNTDMWGMFWSIKFDHFKVLLVLLVLLKEKILKYEAYKIKKLLVWALLKFVNLMHSVIYNL